MLHPPNVVVVQEKQAEQAFPTQMEFVHRILMTNLIPMFSNLFHFILEYDSQNKIFQISYNHPILARSPSISVAAPVAHFPSEKKNNLN